MLRCIRCAACLTSCPTYVVTHKEEEGPRGRIAIMRAMVEGHLDITPDGIEHLDNCLLCEACTNVCPAGVQMESMGIAFRETLAQRNTSKKSLPQRFAFGWLFGELGSLPTAGATDLALSAQRCAVARPFARHSAPAGHARHGSHAAHRARQFRGTERSDASVRASRVHVFAGCIMSTAFAPTTNATARLVAAFGCQAEFTRGQVCCGALQAHSGDVERARELARQNIAALGDGDAPIVVNAAGCGAMLKHYGQLLPDDPAAAATGRARARHHRVPGRAPADATAARSAADGHGPGPVSPAARAAHLRTAAHTAARDSGPELREMDQREICCGSAGIYNVGHPAMSGDLQTTQVRQHRRHRLRCGGDRQSGLPGADPGWPAGQHPGAPHRRRAGRGLCLRIFADE